MSDNAHEEARDDGSSGGTRSPAAVGHVVVVAAFPDALLDRRAESLARELGMPWLRHGDWTGESDGTAASISFRLVVASDRLTLHEGNGRHTCSLCVDFFSRAAGFQRPGARSRRQPLARAIGAKRGSVSVIDATAGLARDAFLIASLGCHVTAVERCPALAALVGDGLRRARESSEASAREAARRIMLVSDDARKVLARVDDSRRPDAVYLDPMYPIKKKTALAKKEIRLCRRLVGDDGDASELLAIARQAASRRVVVKRHPDAPPLAPRPTLQYRGKMVRYDVYLNPCRTRGG